MMAARFFSALGNTILRLRWIAVVFVVLATVGASWQLPRLKLDTSNEIWFVEGDPALQALRKFQGLFRNDDFVYVVLTTDDFFRPQPIATMEALAADLEASVPYVLDITWLGNAEYIEGYEDSIDVYEFLEDEPRTAEALRALRSKALAEPVYRDTLVSGDGKTAAILIELEEYPEDRMDPRKEIAPAVREVLARPEYRGLELHAVGIPLFDYDFDVVTATETVRFMAMCLVLQAGILFWLGRGVRGLIVPLAICALTILWTFGAIVLYDFTLNIFVVMLPVLLICVGIGDSMHLIAEWQDQSYHGYGPRASVLRAMSNVGLPCLLTTMTTAAGFLAFLTAGIRPFREMGIYAATGVGIALILTYLIVPLVYGAPGDSERHDESDEDADCASGAFVVAELQRRDLFDRLLASIAGIVTRRPGLIVAVFALLTAAAVAGMARVEIESATVQMLSTDVPIRRAYDFVDRKMGSSMSVEILLDSGVEGGINEPDFLQRMEALDTLVRGHSLTATTTSVLDIHRQMRRAFHENDPEYYTIPVSPEEAAQYLLLYEMSGGADRDKLTTYNYDVARLTARTSSLDTRDTRLFINDVIEYTQRTFGDTVAIEHTGMLPLLDALTDLIGAGQARSFAAAAIIISMIMMLLLRSVRLGLISMIPNVFPVIATLGLMGYAGIYLGVGLMTISAIIIGVAVDDTIHFFVRYRTEWLRTGDCATAIRTTLTTVGRPLVFTTMTLTLGFSVLGFSDVSQIVKFGLLAGFAFTCALLADLLFAPAMLMLTERKRAARIHDHQDNSGHGDP